MTSAVEVLRRFVTGRNERLPYSEDAAEALARIERLVEACKWRRAEFRHGPAADYAAASIEADKALAAVLGEEADKVTAQHIGNLTTLFKDAPRTNRDHDEPEPSL